MKAYFEGGFPHICGKQSLYDILNQKGFDTAKPSTTIASTTETITSTTETIVGFADGADKVDSGRDRSTRLESDRKIYITSKQIMGNSDYWKQIHPPYLTVSLSLPPPMNILKHLR